MHIPPWTRSFPLVAGLAAIGCSEPATETDATDSDTADDTSTESTPINGCSEANRSACEYASQGLEPVIVDLPAITDEITGRNIPMRARIPAGASGTLPLVIYSHGGPYNAEGHLFGVKWAETWAAHGYLALSIGHVPPASVAEGMLLCDLADIPASECVADTEDDTGQTAFVRGMDLRAVLDYLPDLSAASVARGGPAIDLERVFVAGWSGGARAPQAMMGVTVYPTASAPLSSLEHPLPIGAIACSPMGPPYGGYFDDGTTSSWSDSRGPILMFTGENDLKETKPDLTGAIRRQAYELQPADGSRYLLYSHLAAPEGAHGTYNLDDVDSTDPNLASFSAAAQSTARAFLDFYAFDDPDAGAWLHSQNAAVLAGNVDWEHK